VLTPAATIRWVQAVRVRGMPLPLAPCWRRTGHSVNRTSVLRPLEPLMASAGRCASCSAAGRSSLFTRTVDHLGTGFLSDTGLEPRPPPTALRGGVWQARAAPPRYFSAGGAAANPTPPFLTDPREFVLELTDQAPGAAEPAARHRECAVEVKLVTRQPRRHARRCRPVTTLLVETIRAVARREDDVSVVRPPRRPAQPL
jgi:hypothetical protein